MMLEDITDRFWRPCILDAKIDRHVWDNFAENDKIEGEKKKYQEVIGWRITRVYHENLLYSRSHENCACVYCVNSNM